MAKGILLHEGCLASLLSVLICMTLMVYACQQQSCCSTLLASIQGTEQISHADWKMPARVHNVICLVKAEAMEAPCADGPWCEVKSTRCVVCRGGNILWSCCTQACQRTATWTLPSPQFCKFICRSRLAMCWSSSLARKRLSLFNSCSGIGDLKQSPSQHRFCMCCT